MIERLRPGASAARARVVLFDFDGTISTIRSGWMDVMVPMMVEILSACKTGESEAQLSEIVREFVSRLTGKQTIYQMIELVRQLEQRGCPARDPLEYKKLYLDLLHARIAGRLAELRAGGAAPDQYMLPGTRALLDALRARELTMYLASGTDQPLLREETELLGLTEYFSGGVYGALDDYKSFSKRMLIQNLIAGSHFRGDEFLGFGDGYVEIENVREVDGVAVGVASDEPECLHIDEWKRERLIRSGADLITPNYLALDELMAALFEPKLDLVS